MAHRVYKLQIMPAEVDVTLNPKPLNANTILLLLLGSGFPLWAKVRGRERREAELGLEFRGFTTVFWDGCRM